MASDSPESRDATALVTMAYRVYAVALHARGYWAQRQTLERLAQAALSQAVEHRSRVAFEGLVEIRSLMRDGTFARLDVEDLQAVRSALESLDQHAPRNEE